MDHVHIFSGPGITKGLLGALGSSKQTNTQPALGDQAISSLTAPASSPDTAPAATPTGPPSASSSISMPSSISGLSGWGLGDLGKGVGTTKSGSDLSLFGKAAASAVEGQVASALNVFGIGDSPPWLQAASKFVSGISVSRTGGATPTAAAPLMTGPPDIAPMSSSAGQQPGVTYNIAARDTEDAFIRAQRKERERAAARLERF
jgi:hypothetical protein